MTTATTERQPELAGQTVVLIGGSAGMGLETARRARAEGADVILTGRNPDRLERAAAEIGDMPLAVAGGRAWVPARPEPAGVRRDYKTTRCVMPDICEDV